MFIYVKVKKKVIPINKEIIEIEFNNLITKIKFTFTEREQMKVLLGIYFTKYNYLNDNIINFSKNGEYNIKKLKEFLKV